MNARTAVLAIIALAAAPLAFACGASDVCGDVSSVFSGTVGQEGVVLSWSTDDENFEVVKYDLYRYDCSTPTTCSEYVATVFAAGSCGQAHEYEYVDEDGDDTWTYTLEVWKNNGTRACAVDASPE